MSEGAKNSSFPPPMPMDVWYAEQARAKRNNLLARTDWVVIRAQETNTSVPADWVSYRQSLRDISVQPGFPESVIWPQKPE